MSYSSLRLFAVDMADSDRMKLEDFNIAGRELPDQFETSLKKRAFSQLICQFGHGKIVEIHYFFPVGKIDG